MNLKKGYKIELLIGDEIEVLEKIGEGGQGVVYRISLHGQEYALKWYKKKPTSKFYANLKKNIEKGAPSSAFLWPLYLTKKDVDGCFGYVMNIREKSYVSFSNFLLAKCRFKSVSAMMNAALIICYSFKSLHNKGYSYQDINDGNFFINPENGDVLICDNDNVAPFGENLGIVGKCRYMAPEVVLGKSLPNTQSDRFSLSIILFLLLFNNHPLEGRMITSCPCLTEEYEKRFYGTDPVFIFDKERDINRPVLGIHTNVIKRWPLFPVYIQEIFRKAFSVKTITTTNERIIESEWIKVFFRLRDELITCQCNNEIFVNIEEDVCSCLNCKQKYKRPVLLKIDGRIIALSKNKVIYESNTDNIIGIVSENKKYTGMLGLKNLTNNVWVLTNKDLTQRPIAKDTTCPLLVGNKVNIGNASIIEVI